MIAYRCVKITLKNARVNTSPSRLIGNGFLDPRYIDLIVAEPRQEGNVRTRQALVMQGSQRWVVPNFMKNILNTYTCHPATKVSFR